MNWLNVSIVILCVWNTFVFLMYGLDKSKAKRGKPRISEARLILAAALMGGIGALTGMIIFRHKTKHIKFLLGVPLLLAINIALVVITTRILLF